MEKIKVAVNGYGVIGKRVADAVTMQNDMALVGVADITSDYKIRVAVERDYPVFASDQNKAAEMNANGIPVRGSLDDLLSKVDIVIDCTPKKIGIRNKEIYQARGIKAIWQGGEKHEISGCSFIAQANYSDALKRQFARVVSCNTTGISRILHPFVTNKLVKRARSVMMRRSTDPWESHVNGLINTAIPEVKIPSHQGPDVKTIYPGLNITTIAGSGPYNLGHLHFLMIETTRKMSIDEVRNLLWQEPRVAFVHASNGLVALNSVVELMRDLRRPRGDMWEVAVWEDALAVDDTDIYINYQVDNEAIVIPENIDCIRALTGITNDPKESMQKTDSSLGITKSFLPATLNESEIHKKMGERIREAREKGVSYKGAEEPGTT